jgi:hypothetical protein
VFPMSLTVRMFSRFPYVRQLGDVHGVAIVVARAWILGTIKVQHEVLARCEGDKSEQSDEVHID